MIILALGSNLSGDFPSSEAVLRAALDVLIQAGITVISSSSLYRTAPMPVSDQNWYCNAVALVETGHDPVALLKALKDIERTFGPRDEFVRNGPRVLDLDIIDYHGLTCTTHDPILPHPRMHERGFVLYPLQELVPGWQHPVLKKSVATLIDEIKTYQHVQKSDQGAA